MSAGTNEVGYFANWADYLTIGTTAIAVVFAGVSVLGKWREYRDLLSFLTTLDTRTVGRFWLWRRRSFGLAKPVGYGWTKLLRFAMSQRAFDRHFRQPIADARLEEAEALAKNDLAEARRIRWAFHYAAFEIILKMISGLPVSLVTAAFKGEPDKDE